MTNKQIANKVAKIVFDKEGNSPDCNFFGLQLFLETFLPVLKYSNDGNTYNQKNLEKVIVEFLNEYRINGKHFLDLSER